MQNPMETEPEMKLADTTVGSLVWVKRPNGRWWPGRILGADEEVPDNNSVPQKSAIPVKLFGNDNAEVHWINLEKSTRVKAFRCGEFNDCIEKVKDSSSRSLKKDLKYSRRDAAILQALELEGGLQDCVVENYKLIQSGMLAEVASQERRMTKQFPQGKRHRTPNDSGLESSDSAECFSECMEVSRQNSVMGNACGHQFDAPKRLFDVPFLPKQNKTAGVSPGSRIKYFSLKWRSKGMRRRNVQCKNKNEGHEFPRLCDVHVGVNSGTYDRVPFICLASKSQDRTFVGHPVTVEVLEDGACRRMLASYASSEGELVDTRPSKKRFTSSVSLGKPSKAKKKKGKMWNLSSITGSRKHKDDNKKGRLLSGTDERNIIPVEVAMNAFLKDLLRPRVHDIQVKVAMNACLKDLFRAGGHYNARMIHGFSFP